MSADHWLEIDTGGPEPAAVGRDHNVTYNVTRMLREAGYPGHRATEGMRASDLAVILGKVVTNLHDPKFDAYDAPNGWGTRETTLQWASRFYTDCLTHPNATVRASL
jgi:hypothetical protein